MKKIDGSSQPPTETSPCLGNPSRIAQGNLRFPLTLTYHGCPRRVPNQVSGFFETAGEGRRRKSFVFKGLEKAFVAQIHET